MASPSIVLITGANTGLGYEAVRALMGSEKAHTILLGSRSLEKGMAAAASAREEFPTSASSVAPVQIDIEDDASMAACVAGIAAAHGRLDVLVNNAGAQFDPKLASGELSVRQAWDRSWSLNVTSTHKMTLDAMPLLLSSQSESSSPRRLVFVTSGLSTLHGQESNMAIPLNKPAPAGWPKAFMGLGAYRSSKTGMNMMVREWVRLLADDGVLTFNVSPGQLATGLGAGVEANKNMGALDPALGGNFMRAVIEGERDADAGKIITRDGFQEY